jgi:hypothetical protein
LLKFPHAKIGKNSRYVTTNEDNKKVITNNNSVSIPQAVSTIAIKEGFYMEASVRTEQFQYRKR